MSARLLPALAQPGDDEALRDLLARSPVTGSMTVTYRTEPSYFAAGSLLGSHTETIVGRDPESGRIDALACRSIRDRYLGGESTPVGYLSGLRVGDSQQGRWVVSRGLRELRELDRDGRTRGYFATVVDGAREALGVLVESRRPGFPRFAPLARLLTFALLARRIAPLPSDRGGVRVRLASRGELPVVADFLAEVGARRSLFPRFTAADLAGITPQGAGIGEGDVLVAERSGRIVGSVLLWDQRSLKQAVVNAYAPATDRLRPVIDAASRLLGGQPLPALGETIPMAYASLLTVAGDDVAIARALIRAAVGKAARRGIGIVMLGMTEDDPLLSAVRRLPTITYRSTVFAIGWDDSAAWLASRCAQRPLHVEIAML
jgi:hypothetical protein